MPLLQDLVYKHGTGGKGYFRALTVMLAVLLLAIAYDLRDYRNFSTQEAMDAAQLGRRIAEGKGYTTAFIRPFSMDLIQGTNRSNHTALKPGTVSDDAQIRGAPPDISNPPVYPVVLAGLMKVIPFRFTASTTKSFWSSDGRFWRYQPDFLIAVFNEALFGAVVVLAFGWARRLFDPGVAWTTVVLLLGSDVLWRFSASGLSTMLLLLCFMGLIWCLTLLEAETRAPERRSRALFVLAAVAGLLVGLGGLTRYSFGWLLLPMLVFLALFTGSRRGVLCLVALAAFAAVMTPWIVRNWNLSGTPFGTATYDLLQGTPLFPGNRLERSLAPTLQLPLSVLWGKLFANTLSLLKDLLPGLGGGWITAFFLVGLLVGFRNPAIRRMRCFLLLCLGLLILVQALGRTHLSDDSPEINSDNLLVLLLPLVVVYGISLFYTLLDQINFTPLVLRPAAVGAFGLLTCLPMLFTLSTRTSPVVYPPYHPLLIQQTASWMKEDELIMSDIPWAMAWYGDRQCVWLTLNATADPNNPSAGENFSTINDSQKPIRGLYLTQKTTDSRFVSDWIRAGDGSWGNFITDAILKREVPVNFPLRQMPTGYMPEQLFLSDWKRWQ
jgi:hypothetical protein